MSRFMNPWNCMQSYRCMQFSWQRSQNFHSTAKCCCGPQTLILTTLEEFLRKQMKCHCGLCSISDSWLSLKTKDKIFKELHGGGQRDYLYCHQHADENRSFDTLISLKTHITISNSVFKNCFIALVCILFPLQ